MIDNISNHHHRLSRITLISILTILWMLIPFLIFSIFFYKPYLSMITIISCYYLCDIKHSQSNLIKGSFDKEYLLAIFMVSLVAAGFTIFWSGVIPPLYFNNDWIKSFFILDLLTKSSWPPTILHENTEYFLRYNLAFYIMPSLMNKAIPFGFGWLYIYELIGTTLFFILLIETVLSALNKRPSFLSSTLIIILFLGFSGADSIGAYLLNIDPPFKNHIEWWLGALRISYSSITTQLFWVPQHALIGWLSTILIYLDFNFSRRLLGKNVFLIYCLVFFWSPLVFLGLIFIILITAVKPMPPTLNKDFLFKLISIISIMIPVFLYYNSGINNIPIKTGLIFRDWFTVFDGVWLSLFLLLEVLIYILFIYFLSPDRTTKKWLMGMIFSFTLPIFIQIGIVNEIGLKSTIPNLMLMSLFITIIIMRLYYKEPAKKRFVIPLIIFYLIGMITPVLEFSRAVLLPRENISISTLEGAFILKRYYSIHDPENEFFLNDDTYGQYFSPLENAPSFMDISPDIYINIDNVN